MARKAVRAARAWLVDARSIAGAVDRKHETPMLLFGLILPIGLAADAAPTTGQARTAVLSVGATVIRPPAPPLIAVRGGSVLVTDPGGVAISVEGGALRRQPDGTLRVEPAPGAPTRITITY